MAYIGNSPLNSAFPLDTFTGDGVTVVYTMSFAPASTNSMVVSVDGVKQAVTTYGINGYTLTFSEAPPSSSTIEILFLGIPASGVTNTAYRTETEFTATSGQTTFNVPSYTPGFISVFQNGIKLGSEDFTATNGVTVVLALGATTGDFIEVESFFVSSINNAVSQNGGSFSGNVQFPKGTAAAPSLFFNEATTSGLYSNVNTLGISTNGNSAIFIDSIQEVGIGTITPTNKLTVVDNSSNAAVRITQTGAGAALVVEDSASPDATPFVIDASGTLLAGFTTAPAGSYKAYISGTSFHTSSVRVGDDTDGSTSGMLQNLSNSTKSMVLSADPDNLGASTLMRFDVDGTERMRIDSAGNVGIGASPAFNLDVSGAGIQTIRARTLDTSGTNLARFIASYVGGGGGTPATVELRAGSAYTFLTSTTNTDLLFGTNTTERMRITSAGNVGIGTTSPTVISGYTVFEVNGNTSGSVIDLAQGDVMRGRLVGAASSFAIETSGSIPIGFVPGGVERMRITSAGNLGIGTISPNVRTEVSGTEVSVALRVNAENTGVSSSNFSEVQLSDNGVVRTYWRSMRDGTGATILSYNNHLRFDNLGTERMRIDSSGNVGIGTTNPGMRLELGGSFGGMRLRNTTDVPGFTDIQQSYSGVPELRIGSAVGNDTTAALRIRQGSAGDVLVNGNFLFNSGYGSAATAYGCRAWVNFNGTGTVAIRGSGNVSSITDEGVGRYVVNLTTAMPDANGSVLAFCYKVTDNSQNYRWIATGYRTPSASSFGIHIGIAQVDDVQDAPIITAALFR